MSTLNHLGYPSYPPTEIFTEDGLINILQLTDLHLSLDDIKSQDIKNNDNKITCKLNNYQTFIACLQQALNEPIRCDLILLTGDLVNEVKPEIYELIYLTLVETGIPFACIAGNHDVTDELGADLPFHNRTFIAHKPHSMLLSRHCIQLNNWKLLLIDSSVQGEIYGTVGNKNLNWLSQNLANSHYPVIIAMHHHVLPMDSAWIDKHITKDKAAFWHLINSKPSVKAVVSGHVHQFFEQQTEGIKVYTTPSTCYQFKPKSDDFAIEDHEVPGYRWLTLTKQNIMSSWVKRLSV
ncbi:metallophosphoesterase [Psychrobacter sp.]|uniref:metallophosphoesterase n=1 Tax=Psychrobacter sp. TaxID=56811 RepID=UPI0025F143C5|nr:metallophosphoesterase [Psychrobacter sp.]